MPEATLLDVREDVELMAFSVPGAKHIPLGQLRARLGELDKAKQIVVFCAIGVRAYNAARILKLNGFERVLVYPGGARFYQATHLYHGGNRYLRHSARSRQRPYRRSGRANGLHAH